MELILTDAKENLISNFLHFCIKSFPVCGLFIDSFVTLVASMHRGD